MLDTSKSYHILQWGAFFEAQNFTIDLVLNAIRSSHYVQVNAQNDIQTQNNLFAIEWTIRNSFYSFRLIGIHFDTNSRFLKELFIYSWLSLESDVFIIYKVVSILWIHKIHRQTMSQFM